MTYAEIESARAEAEADIKCADLAVRQAVSLIAGRLRSAGCWNGDLVRLKAELKDFNAITRKWKDAS